MPRISFTPDNKIETKETYPRLKLKKDESARVVVLEDATYVYIHTLRAPELDDQGKPVMAWVERGREKEQVLVNKMKFVGRHQCLGDEEVIKAGRGIDPDGCIMCEASTRNSQVGAPERRFGVHVAHYDTKEGTFEVSTPFHAKIKAWTFTEGVFERITGFQTEHGPLLQHDLLLGPCSAETYQKFDINVAGSAAWLSSEDNKKYVAAAFESNKSDDLESLIAKRQDIKWIEQDLKTVRQSWDKANGVETSSSSTSGTNLDPGSVIGNGKRDIASVVAQAVDKPVSVVEAPAPVVDDTEEVEPEPKPRRGRKPASASAETPSAVPAPVFSDSDTEEAVTPVVKPKTLSFDQLMNLNVNS